MIERVRNILTRSTDPKNVSLEALRERLWQQFEKNPAHQWILTEPELKRSFQIALGSLSQKACEHFLKSNEIVFIPSSGSLACALGARQSTDVILIFPDLVKVFHSASYLRGVAVILHEMGHLFHEHSKKIMDILEAQVEADHFALTCGFGHELQEVLLDSPQTTDTRVRISRLTAEILTSGDQDW